MASASSNAKQSLYPDVDQSHPDLNTPFFCAPTTSTGAGTGTGSSLYPTIDPNELARTSSPRRRTTEETVVAVPGAQLHLVDPDRSLDLGAGTLSIVRLRQGDHSVAVLARLVPEKPHNRRGLFRLFSSGRSDGGAWSSGRSPAMSPRSSSTLRTTSSRSMSRTRSTRTTR